MQEIWDLWMKRGVRKALNIYYSKVQIALLYPMLKEKGKRKRRDLTANATEQTQVRLGLTWQKGPPKAEWREGTVIPPQDWNGNTGWSRGMQIHGSRTWVLVLDHRSLQDVEEDAGWTPFTCQTAFVCSILIYKTKKGKTKFHNSVTVKQESGTIKCDT